MRIKSEISSPEIIEPKIEPRRSVVKNEEIDPSEFIESPPKVTITEDNVREFAKELRRTGRQQIRLLGEGSEVGSTICNMMEMIKFLMAKAYPRHQTLGESGRNHSPTKHQKNHENVDTNESVPVPIPKLNSRRRGIGVQKTPKYKKRRMVEDEDDIPKTSNSIVANNVNIESQKETSNQQAQKKSFSLEKLPERNNTHQSNLSRFNQNEPIAQKASASSMFFGQVPSVNASKNQNLPNRPATSKVPPISNAKNSNPTSRLTELNNEQPVKARRVSSTKQRQIKRTENGALPNLQPYPGLTPMQNKKPLKMERTLPWNSHQDSNAQPPPIFFNQPIPRNAHNLPPSKPKSPQKPKRLLQSSAKRLPATKKTGNLADDQRTKVLRVVPPAGMSIFARDSLHVNEPAWNSIKTPQHVVSQKRTNKVDDNSRDDVSSASSDSPRRDHWEPGQISFFRDIIRRLNETKEHDKRQEIIDELRQRDLLRDFLHFKNRYGSSTTS